MSDLRGDIRAIAFDFDGVIADSMTIHEKAWEAAVEIIPRGSADAIRDVILRNLFEGKAGPQMFDGLAIPSEWMDDLRRAKDHEWERIRDKVRPYPAAGDVLSSLGARLPLAVATTAEKTFVESFLTQYGLRSALGLIVTNADVRHPKPAPDMLRLIANHYSVECSELLMVGDSQSDELMARSAGSAFVWFAPDDPVRRRNTGRHPVVKGWIDLRAALSASTWD